MTKVSYKMSLLAAGAALALTACESQSDAPASAGETAAQAPNADSSTTSGTTTPGTTTAPPTTAGGTTQTNSTNTPQ